MEAIIIIKRSKLRLKVSSIILLFLIANIYSQTVETIYLDKTNQSIIDEELETDNVPLEITTTRFNEVVKLISYKLISDKDYSQSVIIPPIINQGIVFTNYATESAYSLDSICMNVKYKDFSDSLKSSVSYIIFRTDDINRDVCTVINSLTGTYFEININPNNYIELIKNDILISKVKKKETSISLFGTTTIFKDYLAAINLTSLDTVWERKYNPTKIIQCNKVSFVEVYNEGIYVIDNISGKELLKITSTRNTNLYSAITEGNIAYISLIGFGLYAIDLNEKIILWQYNGEVNKIFIDEKNIYTRDMKAFDKVSGNLLWKNSSNVIMKGIIGNNIIGYLYGEDDSEINIYNKHTGKIIGSLWLNNDFCNSCFHYNFCNPEFVFTESGHKNKTSALIKCRDGLYLCIFAVVDE